jgi:hypothetical protein
VGFKRCSCLNLILKPWVALHNLRERERTHHLVTDCLTYHSLLRAVWQSHSLSDSVTGRPKFTVAVAALPASESPDMAVMHVNRQQGWPTGYLAGCSTTGQCTAGATIMLMLHGQSARPLPMIQLVLKAL